MNKFFKVTVNFVLMVAFIIIFQTIFGAENTLIGVTTITAALMFLAKDLTLNPVKKTLSIILFNIFLGVMAYIANTNIFIGIPINFIVMFIIGFTLCHNLRTPSYLPFSLQYLFMLATPISLEQLPLRIGSLVVGGIIIMIPQLIFNRGRISKVGDGLLLEVASKITEKVKLLRKNEDTSEIDNQIKGLVLAFRKLLYEKKDVEFYFTEEGRIKLGLAIALERINYYISKLTQEEFNEAEEDIIICIDNIQLCLTEDKNFEVLELLFKELARKKGERSYNLLTLMNLIQVAKENLMELKVLERKEYDKIKKTENVPDGFRFIHRVKKEFTRYSIRFTYGFRLGLGISFGAFIGSLFGLAEGRWIYFTINSINQPQYEVSKERTLDRFVGTVIGTIIIFTLFIFIEDLTLRGIIIMTAGYIGNYFVAYRYKTIFVTASAIGSAALVGDILSLAEFRIFYMILGLIIAMFISKYIFPFDLKKSNQSLVRIYDEIVESMYCTVYNKDSQMREVEMKNLLLNSGLVEDKLVSNNLGNYSKELIEYLTMEHEIIMVMYGTYISMEKGYIDRKNGMALVEYAYNKRKEIKL